MVPGFNLISSPTIGMIGDWTEDIRERIAGIIGTPAAVSGVVALATCAWIAASEYRIVNDDTYITFVYARNLAEGRGLVFQPAERVLGTTSPLWAIVLASTDRWLGLDVPDAARLAALFCLSLTGLLLRDLLAPASGPTVLLLLAPGLFFGYPMWIATGNETALVLLLVTMAIWLARHERLRASYVVAVIGFLARGEAALVAPVVWLCARRRGQRTRIADVAPAVAVAAGIAVGLFAMYGTIVPNTLMPKTAERYTPGFAVGLPRVLPLVTGLRDNGPLLVVVGIAGLAVLVSWGPAELWLWPIAHAVGYTIIGAGSHEWYYYSLGWLWVNALACAVSIGLERGPAFVRRWKVPSAMLAGLVLLSMTPMARQPEVSDRSRHACYVEVTRHLIPRVRAGDEVVAQEIGILGYLLPAPVRDFDFLVHGRPPDVAPGDRPAWLVTTRRPRFLVTTAFRHDGQNITRLDFGYPERPSIAFGLVDVVSTNGYAAAIYERVGQ